jgi:hypothetical protein
MPKRLLLVAALAAAAPACVVHDSGRGTMSSGSSSTLETAPELAKGAATLGAVALCIGFLYLQAGH